MSDIDLIFEGHGLTRGRCFGSKSAYRDLHPLAVFFPNSWVGDLKGKLWGGDIDLTSADLSRLQQVALVLDRTLYVLREQVGEVSGEEVLRRAQAIVTAEDCTLTPAAQIDLGAALAGGQVRLTRTPHNK
jgi:hypothetical protein